MLIPFFTFLSGMGAILAPCIWPLLPIVLSSTNSQGKAKGVGTVIGLVISFTVATIAISFIVSLFAVNTEMLRKFSAIILFMLGLTFIITPAMVKIEAGLSRLSSGLSVKPTPQKTDFLGGLITGITLGLVWSPCAAPILAVVATISATQSISIAQVINIFSFALGLAIPLLALTFFGSYLFTKTRFLSSRTHQIQKIFGVIILATAVMIFVNYDRTLQKIILEAFPAFNNFLANIES
ncbi:MAG: cytochrome c biogenesis CcdA family protein [Candidatus Curtissbacteria bacterium]